MPDRQIRVTVYGALQGTYKVSQAEPLEDVAKRVQEALRLGHLVPHVYPGMIDFRRT